MPRRDGLKPWFMLGVLAVVMVLLQSCDLYGQNNASSTPSPTADTSTMPLNTWVQVAPGAELRSEQWQSMDGNNETVTIARFDLHRIHISVGYQSHNPPTLSGWMKQTNALAAINGGYFDSNNISTALVVSDGQAYGTSYQSSGGMLSVDKDGSVSLRSLNQQPYDPSTEQLQQAIQSWPMLVVDGKATQFTADSSDRRRSVVAMDKQGRLLLIVSPSQAFALVDLANQLVSSDLSIQTALNLDGGRSTGLYVNSEKQKVSIDPVTALPIVILFK